MLNVTAMISAAITAFFGIQGLFIGQDWWVTARQPRQRSRFVMIPRLCGMGEIVAPVVFFVVSYFTITVLCVYLGTGSGLQFYFVVAAAIMLVVLGTDHIVLASTLSAIGAATVILLEFFVPNDTGTQPPWAFRTSFVLTVITAWMLVIATIWFTLREIRRAREAMEAEYERSEQLLANILPATIAERLKDPSRNIIADKYDDASILFADIAGYTKRASDTAPDRSGAVPGSAVHRPGRARRPARPGEGQDQRRLLHGGQRGAGPPPRPRPGAGLSGSRHGRCRRRSQRPARDATCRCGSAWRRARWSRVSSARRKFFYDVWGDAVNVASRMETTDVEGRIQVPDDVYERLQTRIRARGARRGRHQRQGRDADLVPGRPARRHAVRSAVEHGAVAGRLLDLPVLRLDQPGQLLQAVDELVQDVGGAGILGIHRVVHRPEVSTAA